MEGMKHGWNRWRWPGRLDQEGIGMAYRRAAGRWQADSRPAVRPVLKELAAQFASHLGQVHAPGVGIDAGWCNLASGAVHEWFSAAPPLSLFASIAASVSGGGDSRGHSRGHSGGAVVWIGRRVWPHPRTLVWGVHDSTGVGGDGARDIPSNHLGLLVNSLFIDPPDDRVRVWLIDLALRCPAVRCVVADGRGLTMAQSRRLQLAAKAQGSSSSGASAGDEAASGADSGGGSGGHSGRHSEVHFGGGGVIALLARPLREMAVLSAAATRWRVATARSPTRHPRWRVELVRCKGVQPISQGRFARDDEAVNGWTVELDRDEDRVTALSDVVGGSCDAGPDTGIDAGTAPGAARFRFATG